MDPAHRDSVRRAAEWARGRHPGPRKTLRRRNSLAVGALAASLAAAALAVPAEAATKPALIAQAVAGVQRTDVIEEAHHTIPFKSGTKFTITCGFQGENILCNEHAGPEQCVKGRPWILLSDLFPVIKGRVGESLTFGLTVTSHYCQSS
jgi:hypothetical protein